MLQLSSEDARVKLGTVLLDCPHTNVIRDRGCIVCGHVTVADSVLDEIDELLAKHQ